MNLNSGSSLEIIIIEAFFGGSHKVLVDTLTKHLQIRQISFSLVTLPAKKWHWRARCGALQIYDKIPQVTSEKVLWTSSVLNLAELLGLRPDLIPLKKVVYFHENQLIYPVQEIKSRDVQYSYNQITTSLVADIIIFNSFFNMQSFLDNIPKILRLFPDHKPKSVKTEIEKKSKVLYFPISFLPSLQVKKSTNVVHIVWPHRWEFDKGPTDFFNVIFRLKKDKLPFRLYILGETYKDVPDVFQKAKQELSEEIIQFGFVDSKEDYYKILSSCHVAVSTAKHEFFGVSMLEASYCGCFPLVPNALVYPEIFPKICLYSDKENLYKRLKGFCLDPSLSVCLRRNDCDINYDIYSDKKLIPEFFNILGI